MSDDAAPLPAQIDLATHDPDGRDRLIAAMEPLGIDYELFACDPAFADTAEYLYSQLAETYPRPMALVTGSGRNVSVVALVA